MIEIGRIALIIALPVAIFSLLASVSGARSESGRFYKSGRYGILVIFGLYTIALAIVLYAFFTDDFSVKIVAEHSSRDLPPLYSLSALYADKAGSMFLWGWLISLFSALLVWQTGKADRRVTACTMAILSVIEAFYICLVLLVANVFAPQSPPVSDGFGLNPLLQNFGMLVHPPLLYLGFAGFAIVFAMVMAAVINHSPDIWRNTLIRRWAIFAWCVLGIGNTVGMWWSYNELGWGGYWAWDPVENAGLMPWLLGTALVHSIVMGRQRNYQTGWGLYLVVFTFVFTLLSPFITHGGIESPLHGFYGSSFPPYILGAMIVVTIGSLLLLYTRRRDIKSKTRPSSLISREGAFLLTNIILIVLVIIILIGTLLPGIIEAAGGTNIALERNYFDSTCGPIMLLLVFLMGVCPLFGWGKSMWKSLRRNIILFILAGAIVSGIILITGTGNWYIAVVIICGLALFVIFREWWRGTAARHNTQKINYLQAFFSFINSNRARYGGFINHIGVILLTLGIIASSFYSIEKTVTLDIGETVSIGKYELSYEELTFKQDSAKISAVASMLMSRDDREVATMHPSYAYWFSHDNFFAEVAVRTTAAEDLFVSLVWTGFDPDDKSATFRVLVNPMIVWIWVGGGFFLLGGAVSFSFREKQSSGGAV
jgi:cytochrome c-type biogenesis protein CcmF